MRAAGLLLVWLLYSASAAGGTIHNAAVSYQNGSFIVELDALLDVDESTARAVLTDYKHLERLIPAVERSEILTTREPGDYRLLTVTHTCLWFYCKRLTRVQDVVEAHDGSITAVVIPQLSDFSYGTMRLNLWQETAGTRILVRSEAAPDVWIPPLLGPWLIKRELRAEAVQAVHNLEQVAAEASLPHEASPEGGLSH